MKVYSTDTYPLHVYIYTIKHCVLSQSHYSTLCVPHSLRSITEPAPTEKEKATEPA